MEKSRKLKRMRHMKTSFKLEMKELKIYITEYTIYTHFHRKMIFSILRILVLTAHIFSLKANLFK